MTLAFVLRSPVAHAQYKARRCDRGARRMPGVLFFSPTVGLVARRQTNTRRSYALRGGGGANRGFVMRCCSPQRPTLCH